VLLLLENTIEGLPSGLIATEDQDRGFITKPPMGETIQPFLRGTVPFFTMVIYVFFQSQGGEAIFSGFLD